MREGTGRTTTGTAEETIIYREIGLKNATIIADLQAATTTTASTERGQGVSRPTHSIATGTIIMALL
jgi:hypothetical protein